MPPWVMLIILVGYWISRYRRLSSFPGPVAAAYTDLWRAYHTIYRDGPKAVADAHRKYGAFVRIAPNVISISDPAAIGTVYSMHGEFHKADSYSTLRALSNGKIVGSVIDMQDERDISALRRVVGSAFAAKNLLTYEADVDDAAQTLVDVIRRARTFPVIERMMQYQVDVLMKIAFSQETDYIHSDRSTDAISGHARLGHWEKWQSMPLLERLLYKSPLCRGWYRAMGKPPLWVTMSQDEFTKRWWRQGDDIKPQERPDLLAKYMKGRKQHEDSLSPDALMRMVSSTISAGFDTTASTITIVLYFLVKHPEAMKTLRQEIDTAQRTGQLSNPPTYGETEKLEYLGATIKESQRLVHLLNALLERTVPAGGADILGRWFPGGTVVAIPQYVAQRDPGVYGSDADSFRPERWREADDDRRIAMERTFMAFGAGKRVCLGRHLAELEMKKVITRLLMEFDMTLEDPQYVRRSRTKFTNIPDSFSIVCKETEL